MIGCCDAGERECGTPPSPSTQEQVKSIAGSGKEGRARSEVLIKLWEGEQVLL